MPIDLATGRFFSTILVLLMIGTDVGEKSLEDGKPSSTPVPSPEPMVFLIVATSCWKACNLPVPTIDGSETAALEAANADVDLPSPLKGWYDEDRFLVDFLDVPEVSDL